MEKSKKPLMRLDVTKIDAAAFKAMLEEHTRAIESFSADMAVAIGDAYGHAPLAKALGERISDYSVVRSDTAGRMLDAAWQASTARAQWGPLSRT